MSHEVENMFSVREQAWHDSKGIYTLSGAPSLNEALAIAGLNRRVKEVDLKYVHDGQHILVPGRKAIVREDDGQFYGDVSHGYKILQAQDALDALRPLVEDGTLVLETAGSLMQGARGWILARFDKVQEVKDGDAIIPYLLIAWGHDGKTAVFILGTPIRVVCWNTLSFAGFKEGNLFDTAKGDKVTIVHTGDLSSKVAAAVQAINIARQTFAGTMDVYRAMANKPVDVQTVKSFARELFDADYIKAKALVVKLKQRQQTEEIVKKKEFNDKVKELEDMVNDRENSTNHTERSIITAFEEGPGADLAKSTVWGLVNATTNYIDHKRSNGTDASIKSSWFGSGANYRKQAFEKAMQLL